MLPTHDIGTCPPGGPHTARRHMLFAAARLLAMLTVATVTVQAQPKRLRDIERQTDAVVLIAETRTGRIVAAARIGESHDVRYRPGSLFKLAIAVAALRSGHFDASYTYTCSGKDTIAGSPQRCWNHHGHATIGFSQALAMSCNLYFRSAAERLTIDEIVQAARLIGMVPSGTQDPTPFANLTDETILGNAFSVSPAQMLTLALRIGTRGRLGQSPINLFGSAYRPLYTGLRECVRIGTGQGAWTPRFSVGGKTGTSEVPGRPDLTVGWFVGFAPFADPRYAIVVLQRHARGADAARTARTALREVM